MRRVAVPFLPQVRERLARRMIDFHPRHIADHMARLRRPLAPVAVFRYRQPRERPDLRHHPPPHHQIAGARKAFARNVAVHPVGIDAFIGLQQRQPCGVGTGNPHVAAQNFRHRIRHRPQGLRQPLRIRQTIRVDESKDVPARRSHPPVARRSRPRHRLRQQLHHRIGRAHRDRQGGRAIVDHQHLIRWPGPRHQRGEAPRQHLRLVQVRDHHRNHRGSSGRGGQRLGRRLGSHAGRPWQGTAPL